MWTREAFIGIYVQQMSHWLKKIENNEVRTWSETMASPTPCQRPVKGQSVVSEPSVWDAIRKQRWNNVNAYIYIKVISFFFLCGACVFYISHHTVYISLYFHTWLAANLVVVNWQRADVFDTIVINSFGSSGWFYIYIKLSPCSPTGSSEGLTINERNW